jgi:arsenate reductase (thioredoxin)
MTNEPGVCHDAEECHLLNPDTTLDRAAEHLAERFHGVFSPETVDRYLHESYTLLAATARIQRHTPVLAVRFATGRLTALAKANGAIVTTTPEVLFVCVHNAGRSQMAAALLHHHAAGRVLVRSAGSAPAESINPAVVEAMAELGLDLSREYPKPLTDEAVRACDVVITMGCGDACPVFPGKRYLDWDLPDPAGKPVEQVRPIRDEIDRRVRDLLTELLGDTQPAEQ